MARPRFSVIVPSARGGAALAACLASLGRQAGAPAFEVIVVSAGPPPPSDGALVGWMRMDDPNPAARRNRAAEFAAGEILAFLDDDAQAAPDWLARADALAAGHEVFGGCDIVPPGSPWAERLSDLLLATPGIGSGIPAHGRPRRGGAIRSPSALALCNLFVAREAFDRLGGFDESLGYIGEDTELLRRAMRAGLAPYLDPALVVFHRRRAFPGAFLAQRWRYRVKTGRLLAERPGLHDRGRISAFLLAGAATIAAAAGIGRAFLVPFSLAYAALAWALSAPIWIRDPALAPAVPAAFLLHHATYWTGIVAGMCRGLAARLRGGAPAAPPAPLAPASRLPRYPQ